MSVRSAMMPLINELRRLIYDYGADTLEAGVKLAGDSVRLTATFKNLASIAVTPTSNYIVIYDPDDTIMVTAGTLVSTGLGKRRYDYSIPDAGPEGTWKGIFRGKASGASRAIISEFDVKVKQRKFADQDLQDSLDRYSVFIGESESGRELMRRNATYTRYLSEYDNLEWAKIYDSSLQTASEYTPDSSNLIKGEFIFNAAQNIDLFLEGISYNIWQAAADCLEAMAADREYAYSWSISSVRMQYNNPLDLAKIYRNRGSAPHTITLRRTY